jgi:hypothetical protein
MPVQMIELEEVQMIDLSDEALEATLGGLQNVSYNTSGGCTATFC